MRFPRVDFSKVGSQVLWGDITKRSWSRKDSCDSLSRVKPVIFLDTGGLFRRETGSMVIEEGLLGAERGSGRQLEWPQSPPRAQLGLLGSSHDAAWRAGLGVPSF